MTTTCLHVQAPAQQTSMHIILDLETLALTPDTIITEIGAIAFEIMEDGTPQISEQLAINLDIPEQLALNRGFDPATISWAVSKKTIPSHWRGATFRQALEQLRAFILAHQPEAVWSWGKDFERPILDDAFASLSIPVPFHYTIMRCARDCWWLAFGARKPSPHAHHAIDDCHAELADLAQALSELRKNAGAISTST